MLISAYRNSHPSRIDYRIYKKIVFGSFHWRIKIIVIRLSCLIATDPLRLQITGAYIRYLYTGHYPKISHFYRPRAQSDVNVHEDLCCLLEKLGYTGELPDLSPELDPALRSAEPMDRVFRPVKSGFFSMISNILAYDFLTGQKGAQDFGEWPYAVSISDLIGIPSVKADPTISNESQSDPQRTLKSLTIAHPQFTQHKRAKLKSLYVAAKERLRESGVDVPDTSRSVVYFIRRGDKLRSESLDIPVESYCRSIRKLLNTRPVMVVGDDDLFNAKIKAQIPKVSLHTPFGLISGSHLGQGTDRSLAILFNWILLCDAEDVVGDSNCNLVAMAMSYRGQMSSADTDLFPWTLHAII